jgi:hypothetical protein
MYEVTEQGVEVEVDGVLVHIPVGRIRDIDARAYGLLKGPKTSAELNAAAHDATAAAEAPVEEVVEAPVEEAPVEKAAPKGKK